MRRGLLLLMISRFTRGELCALRQSSSMNPAEDLDLQLRQSELYSPDLAPVPASRRKWGMWSFAALWISMSACIPTYMLASSLIGGGMNWWQAILTIFLAQPDRADPDDSQRARGHALRHSVSGVLPRVVRHAWARMCRRCCARWSRAAGSASRRGSAARRFTKFCVVIFAVADPGDGRSNWLGITGAAISLLPVFLGHQHVGHLSGH